ncbi:MAG: UDP-N-acetylmuramoyl-tripeptide--D-alanyl-D-alanine ligase [Bacillota bacterium]|nr:UDP-N-acetylmuramoyl-tripeptide--D-alanyl-D-alanine ligase [Bacillota bacterium]
MTLPLIAIAALVAYIIICPLRRTIHMLQQNSYRLERYWDWYMPRARQELRKGEIVLILPLLGALISAPAFAAAAFIAAALLLFIYWPRPQAEKKPLVFTARVKRLYALSALFVLIDGFIIAAFLLWLRPWLIVAALALALMCVGANYYALGALRMIEPLERRIANRYLNEAKRRLSELLYLTTVAVTGSYGKTSVKLIAAAICSEKYMTLATPASYNTPMGVTRVIREQLRPLHQVFIAEMGAKQVGDIAELCELAPPKIGILTAIGEQHLESFGSLANIINTKFELIEHLPADGTAVLNFDDANIAANAHRSPCRVISYGLSADYDFWADDIRYGKDGSSFTVHHDADSRAFSCRLLGRHNVSNILAAVAAASVLGVTLAEAARGVKGLQPIEHRLQLRQAQDYYIIDDAFNANPAGAASALEVLSCFEGGQKIVITPGMVELGEAEYRLNYQFGRQMAAVCDQIILVGKKHSLPLQEGVRDADFPRERLFVAADLKEARRHLTTILSPGSVVLFENDLPDSYDEA